MPKSRALSRQFRGITNRHFDFSANTFDVTCPSGSLNVRIYGAPSGWMAVKSGQDAVLAIMSSGAYGFCMSSNYNSRPRVAEVMVKGGQYDIIHSRETYEDLVALER